MAEYSPEQYLASLLTTPKQEARNLRASRSRQRILALGDALRHIGNIYNTTQGAPAQQFNDPVTAERTRYQQDKLLRDANNMKYFSYQQAKQAQDAKQRQWEATFNYNMGRDAAKMQAQQAQWDAQNKERARQFDATLGYRRENDEANRKQRGDHYLEMEKQGRQRIGIAAQNSRSADSYRQWRMNNGGGGGGRSGDGYSLSTAGGRIILSKDFNKNSIGKKQLIPEMRRAGVIGSDWEQRYNNWTTTREAQGLMLNEAIAEWLNSDPNAANYMVQHFGAKSVTQETPTSLNWGGSADDDDDDYPEDDYGTDW